MPPQRTARRLHLTPTPYARRTLYRSRIVASMAVKYIRSDEIQPVGESVDTLKQRFVDFSEFIQEPPIHLERHFANALRSELKSGQYIAATGPIDDIGTLIYIRNEALDRLMENFERCVDAANSSFNTVRFDAIMKQRPSVKQVNDRLHEVNLEMTKTITRLNEKVAELENDAQDHAAVCPLTSTAGSTAGDIEDADSRRSEELEVVRQDSEPPDVAMALEDERPFFTSLPDNLAHLPPQTPPRRTTPEEAYPTPQSLPRHLPRSSRGVSPLAKSFVQRSDAGVNTDHQESMPRLAFDALQRCLDEERKLRLETRQANIAMSEQIRNLQDQHDRVTAENTRLLEEMKKDKEDLKLADAFCFEYRNRRR